MKYFVFSFLSVTAFLGLTGCNHSSSTTVEESSEQTSLRDLLALPDHIAVPYVPDFNPVSEEKIELGRFLFYDKKLSANQTQSCESCHDQSLAFSDGVSTPFGSTGHQLTRNSQGLANVAYHSTFTWSNNGFLALEDQLNVPIRADNPIELGVTDPNLDEVLARFDADPAYVAMFAAAFPDSDSGTTINKIIFSLASFIRTMISANSAYDQYLLGDTSALTEQQKLGFSLFNGEKFECFHCHTGSNFSVSYRDSNTTEDTIVYPFFNNGLYNLDGEGSYPAADQGLYDLTLDLNDRGKFRPQSLRNIELTGPYMHDGSLQTLREVIEHYARGGQLIESGENAGDGNLSPLKSGLITGFDATDDEIDAVIAFLESLTDYEFINNPKFSDPFEEQ
ncbi:MAG: MbnH family di-heme enzyme [Paraglaciecola sp.]|uniref:MbnH family di-heme enzyme n=2 Tax=Paraglaciecola sp. TaxID=1920173 RepID=UPI0032653A27